MVGDEVLLAMVGTIGLLTPITKAAPHNKL